MKYILFEGSGLSSYPINDWTRERNIDRNKELNILTMLDKIIKNLTSKI